MTDFLKLYNPANSSTLTQEQVDGLQTLKPEQIRQLAAAYPNRIFNKGYLLIKDTRSKVAMDKQLPVLSTFENLHNLIIKNNFKGFIAVGFRGQAQQKAVVRPKRSEVIDLSDADLMHLPGFKLAKHNGGEDVIQPETVTVKKINKS